MSEELELIAYLVLIVGSIFLQIFLSKKQNKWLGRILPIITFLCSVLIAYLVAFMFISASFIFMRESGSWLFYVVVSLVFVFYNIPTIILYVIYKVCREEIKRNS